VRCQDCPRYDEDAGICVDGKLNPESLVAAIEVAQHIGPRAICILNDHREQILDIHLGNPLETPPKRRPHTPRRKWHLEI